jgi:3-oxoacyl-[acyl-carrier-protein] synthase-3
LTVERYARVVSLGSALPERTVPNSYFESLDIGTDDEWIVERTGIRERRFAGNGETTASLAAHAGRACLEAAGVGAESIDLLILATCSPDRWMPAGAVPVAQQLGLTCPGFDLNAACAGFVYALEVGAAHVRAGSADRVLVIGADVMSRLLNFQDRTTCVLFGDGAGAMLLEPSPDPGVIDSTLHLDPRWTEALTIPAGGSEEPASPEAVAAGRTAIQMPDGQAVFKRAVIGMADACRSLLDKAGHRSEEVRAVVGHQANVRILNALGRRMGLGPDVVWIDMGEVGNTSAASIPLALDRGWRAGKLDPGDLVLTVAFGAGFAWGANLIRWSASTPAPSGLEPPMEQTKEVG